MVTESLCLIGRQQQQQAQKQEQLESGKAEQTIVFDTKGIIQDSPKAGLENSDDISSTNSNSDSSGSSNRIERDRLCRLLRDIEVRVSPVREDDNKSQSSHPLVDSRSILSNKQRLKEFWELKMDLEFKLRQQRMPLRVTTKRNNDQPQANGKLVSCDTNNNNSSSNDNNNCNDDNNNEKAHSDAVDAINKQLYYSDEEWRSLSPNLEPSSRALQTSGNNNRPTPKQQVSAELVCEKLREYQANAADAERSTSNGETKPVPKSVPTAAMHRSNSTLDRSSLSEEAQLMSIDPSLCHSGVREPHESAVETAAAAADRITSNEEPNSSGCSNNNSFNEREEQTFNEEFSSSNSSFGPMSLSITARQDAPASGDSMAASSIAKSCQSDEDETNSAQSGSVLTVIMKLNSDQIPALTNGEYAAAEENGGRKASMGSDQAVSNNDQSNNDATLDSAQDQELSEADDAECSSNIGVAFESLHFDSEIKSSKHEQVDEDLLRPTPVKRPSLSKFNASEVKSVCSFISAAISDATRQVESYMGKAGPVKTPLGQEEAASPEATGADSEEGASAASVIRRATFVQESGESSASSHDSSAGRQQVEPESVPQLGDSLGSDSESDKVPAADLSSIFEANVRREIEKFETHSVAKKSGGGKLANKNALTEWRIAEEIRLFNEREMELKRRFTGKNQPPADSTCAESNGRSSKSPHESVVVRFGKTLQLPKSESPGQLSKSIRLSASATPTPSGGQQATTMISMHKFIASGGKRFVFSNNHSSSNGSLNSFQLNQNLTKSMSNLSSTRQESARQVDYKAADSLKCKETPQVRSGLTRKVIETFTRMNHQAREHTPESQTLGSGAVRQLAQPAANQQVSPSAEWKIQEELREMRAREAELRSQRIQLVKQVGLHKNGSALSNGVGRAAKEESLGELGNETNSTNQSAENEDDRVNGAEAKLIDRLSFSSESLYPIKQTIDSFRKLNSSSQANTSTPLQLNGTTSEIQRKLLAERQCDNDDYDSRIGGRRRKIPMIERWENKLQ